MANEKTANNQQNSTSELAVRREKLAALVEAGKNPFEITKYDVTYNSVDAIREFNEKESELEASGEEISVKIAGRMVGSMKLSISNQKKRSLKNSLKKSFNHSQQFLRKKK